MTTRRRCARAVSAATLALSTAALAAPRDVQIRTVDFQTGVVELYNFGSTAQPLDGWRFCTHDENQVRQYSGSSGLNTRTVQPQSSFFIHFNNDAPADPDRINVATIGGAFALPLDSGSFGMQLYVDSNFGSGASIADHLQWSIDGIDNASADERSDEAEAGGVWTDQSLWISTAADSLRIELADLTGAVLHSPANYNVINPACSPADLNADGSLNLDDVSLFASNLPDLNADTTFNLDDVSLFVAEFLAGCP